jgi:N-alpha-acetyltransferase 50
MRMTELQPLSSLHLREAQPTTEPQKPPGPPKNLPPLPAHISLTPITTERQLSQFRRITTLLLPIRYPTTFYTEILTSPSTALALIVTYAPPHTPPTVVGGIRCRFEEKEEESPATDSRKTKRSLYILTLCVLAPYRGLGLATHLLERMCAGWGPEGDVYAHVWEANEEARRWYRRRGFWEEEGRVEGYYRRLRPQGAVVVRRGILVEGRGRGEAGAEEADGDAG